MSPEKSLKVAGKLKKPKADKRKGGGGKLSRSEVIQVRLDPRLRFTAELAARKQRRTLSSFIEWAVSEAVKQVPGEKKGHESIVNTSDQIWRVGQGERFFQLALNFPTLLTYEEEVLFALIQKASRHWRLEDDMKNKKNYDKVDYAVLNIVFDEVRDYAKGVTGDMPEWELFEWIEANRDKYERSKTRGGR
jgi:hypothetical protein